MGLDFLKDAYNIQNDKSVRFRHTVKKAKSATCIQVPEMTTVSQFKREN